MSADDTNEGFASRWSRRKLQAENETTPPATEETANTEIESQPLSTGEEQPPAPKTDADMPELASLNNDANYSGFLSEGVSEELRTKALKQLFHLSHFNITDNLDDYDDDYSVFEPLGETVSEHLKQWIDRDPDNTHPRQRDEENLDETEENLDPEAKADATLNDNPETPSGETTQPTEPQDSNGLTQEIDEDPVRANTQQQPKHL
ncbi:DUF3306 domain-containing protein [Aestuariirhabdus sp. LZHN29]|uniref:DUF3306 domain-containing protein n=1 Tax=Aestuariirhabdus sp. LZHN29 TaxID=3417462 RepID=UPI003CFB1BF9